MRDITLLNWKQSDCKKYIHISVWFAEESGKWVIAIREYKMVRNMVMASLRDHSTV